MAVLITERQHFVPRAYLKNFAEKKGSGHYNIHILPINDLRASKIEERNTKTVCYEKNLYTQEGSTAEEKMLLENFYADALENEYDKIYTFLIDPAKKAISDEERDLIIATISTMYYRVPLWIKNHNEFMGMVFDMSKQAAKQFGKKSTTIEGKEYILEGKTTTELVKEYSQRNKAGQVITQLKVALSLIAERKHTDNIFITKLEVGDSQFITSDNPVTIQNIKNIPNPYPFDPANILKVPIDEKHCVMLMPNGDPGQRNNIVRHSTKGGFSKREELLTNLEQLQGADQHIVGSASALNRFLTIKDKEVVLSPEEKKLDAMLQHLAKANSWI